MNLAPYSFISLNDVDLAALINCALRRLVVIVPGLSQSVAFALAEKWQELGPQSVQGVLDPDPEVCRLGLGECSALVLLRQTATKMGVEVLQQPGLRVGLVITDETITVFSPLLY